MTQQAVAGVSDGVEGLDVKAPQHAIQEEYTTSRVTARLSRPHRTAARRST